MTNAGRRRGSLWPPALLVAVAVVAAVAAAAAAPRRPAVPERRTATTDVVRLPVWHPPLHAAAPRRSESPPPERLVVPGLGVDADLVPLGLLPDGAMEVPADAAVAGWYEPGPEPGEAGPAVLAGHVDWQGGPGVFYRLHELRQGDRVTVVRADATQFVFTVRAVERHPKDVLPVERIWADTGEPVLRLVTCAGRFDPATGHYTENVVVYADLAMVTRPQDALQRT